MKLINKYVKIKIIKELTKGSGYLLSELELVNKVAKDVNNKGGRMFYVGGCVRDEIMWGGTENSKDIDVETYGLTLDEFSEVLRNYGEVNEIGKSFGVLNLAHYDIDFSLPRRERKVASGHQGFDVTVDPYISYEGALLRRDFTMNALLKDVLTGELIDPYGGVEDIKNKVIRVVNDKTFIEDELRVFRACQFASRFGFSMDEKVVHLAKEFDYNLSPERMYTEFNKGLLKSKKPSVFLEGLLKTGAIKNYPELEALIGCEQNPEFHPEGDVWNHTLEVLDRAATVRNKVTNPLGFMYGALCHDMGKPLTTKVTNGKITSYNHDIEGVEIAEKFMRRLTNEKDVINLVKDITLNHMIVHRLTTMKPKTVRDWMIKTDVPTLLWMGYADGETETQYKENYARIKELSIGGFGKVVPYVMGKDLIELGFKPGPNLGKILEELYVMELSGLSKEHIMEQASRMYFKENYESILEKYEQVKIFKYGIRAMKWKKRFEEKYDKPYIIHKRFVYTPYGILKLNGKEHLNMLETVESERISLIKALNLPENFETSMLKVYKNLR